MASVTETAVRPGTYRPTYENDEVALGVALAVALHALPVVLVLLHVLLPVAPDSDVPLVGKPVVSATLLKLGKPMDPKKLPDRLVPRARTAPVKETVASQEDPLKNTPKPDAGPPPQDVKDDPLTRLIAHSDPFAEDAGKDRPEEGHAEGIEGGTETDPNKVRAGDMYAAKLGVFFHEKWQYPTVISQGEANRLCVTFQITVDRNMIVWHLREEPVRPSGNPLFDDSARSMLQKLLDDHTPLPQPPDDVAEMYKGRAINIVLSGDLHGDANKCR